MDEQLNLAPCGFFVLNKDLEIIEMNETLRTVLKLEHTVHFQDLLTLPSRVYFQTYFLPAISIHHQVREMYLNFKVEGHTIPLLVNVNERNGLYEGIVVKINTRNEYEAQMLAARKNAERIQKETDLANAKLLALLEDVERKQRELELLNTELEKLAAHDELTGLYNRRVFQKELALAVQRVQAKELPGFSLAILDIDHFKKVNDIYGHAIGDKVLVELTHKMRTMIEKPHLLARIGGEEFTIILYEPDPHKAVAIVEKLREHVAVSPWESIAATISLGITPFREDDNANSLFTRADDALYESKRHGRDRVTYL